MTQIADISLYDWMTLGGDDRIVLDPQTGVNRYFSTPYPRDVLAFASSTANDLSPEADAYLKQHFAEGAAGLEQGEAYGRCLDALRGTIQDAYDLDHGTDIFFAPSGTDLEYVGLLATAGRRAGGIVNHLLGADEVGSGCIHSAAGRYFADRTALDIAVLPGADITGLPPITMADCPVRCEDGEAHESAYLTRSLESSIAAAIAADRFPLVHIVHGSKTGLVLPRLDDVDRLRARFGQDVAFVVDACQARIRNDAIGAYLQRGIIVFITGSKFMGGPPFSGFALIPPGVARAAAPLAQGMAKVFRRAEVPASWPGRAICEDSGNPGLALRLSASLFELQRFQQLGIARATFVVDAFTAATDALAANLGVRKVASAPSGDAEDPADHPIAMRTLVTLDLCNAHEPGTTRALSFDDAVRIHRALIAQGIRLGQPVRCVRIGGEQGGEGQWGATLRIGLSMPQITRLAALRDGEVVDWFAKAMDTVASALAPHLASGA